MSSIIVRCSLEGRREKPLASAELAELFDGVWGQDAKNLPAYPKVIGGVFARWVNRSGAAVRADHFGEVIAAFDAFETREITIEGGIENRPRCTLKYQPGEGYVAFSVAADTQEAADALLNLVRALFPLPPRLSVFISYDTSEVQLASFVKEALEKRLPAGATVFVAKRDIAPGDNPLKVMLEHNLLEADALVAMCSQRSKGSPWLWWEAGSVWARSRLVVPLFIDLEGGAFGGPITLVTQGRQLFDRTELDSALKAVVDSLGAGPYAQLSQAEWELLAAMKPDVRPQVEILFEPTPPFVQDSPGVESIRRVGVRNLTNKSLQDVEVQLASFTPQGAEFLPTRLAIMHDVAQPMSLHPDDTAFADLVGYHPKADYADHIILRYENQKLPPLVPLAEYTLVVRVLAKDMRAHERAFVVSVQSGQLLIRPAQ